jgi:hypothetical protein
MAVQDPYLVPLKDPTRTDLSKEEQAALEASDPYLTPLKDPKRTELSDEEQAKLTERGIEKLRKQGFPEAVLWSLHAPGGSWTDLGVNVGVPMAGSIGGGVLGGLAAAPTGLGAIAGAGIGAKAGGATGGGLADYWTQLREYAREGGGDKDFELKKGRFGASTILGGIVPASPKMLRPVADLPSRTVLKNIPNPNAARDVLGPGLQRTLAEKLPGEFAQDAANYAMTRGAQGAVMAAGANVAEQVIDRPANEDFSFKELGRAAAFGTLAGGAFGVLEKSAPQVWAKIRGKTPEEAVAVLKAEPRSPLIDDALAAAEKLEKPAVVTVKPAAQVDLENAMAAQRSAEILEQNMPPQPVLPPGGGMEAQKYPAGPSNVGLARAEEFGPVIAESEEALRRQASPIGGRNAEFSAQAFEDQAAVQSVAQGDLERAIAARQGAAPEQIPDPARVQAEAFARELPPVEPPSNIELSAQAQQMQDADGWADGVIRRAFKGGRVSSNAFLDPELAAAVAVKGAQLLAKGVKDYDNWGGLMSKEFGEAVRPHLKDLWAKSTSASVMKTPEEFLRASVGDSAGNLRMKLGKRPGTGTAKNALVEFEDLQGRPIAVGADKNFGGKPFGTWASETEKWLNDSEISTFRNWYNELNSKFVSEFGEERAPTMMMAWLAAQQNVSPGGALGNVFKVEDRLAGIGVGKKGGLADKKIEGVLTQQVQSKGFGAKLTDFVDAGFMRRVRSYMGGDARGGEPFVADVHTGRDSGHVDHQTLSRLKDKADEGNLFIAGNPVTIKVTKTKTLQQGKEISQVPTRVWVTAEGMKPFGLNIDQTSSPSGPRYEGISEWGNALTRDLNEKQWKGGNWTPSEVQAVGWMRILRQYGLPEESVATALAKNTGRVYAEVNYSLGAALRNTLPSFGQLPYDTQQAITKEVLEQAVPMIAAKIGGSLRVRSISMGDGMFGGPKAPSAAVEVSGSTEAIDLFTVALAHASEQATTMSVTFGLGGKNSRSVRFKKVDGSKFTGDEITSLIDDAKLGGFSVHQLPGGTEALITDAGENFKPKAFSEKKAQRVFDQITTWADVRKVDIDIDIPTTRVTAYENDWSSHPKGQTYLEILNRRGIGSKVSDLDGLRGEYRTLLEQSFDRYAPGVRQGRGGVLSSPSGVDAGTGAKTSSRQPNEAVRRIADDYNAQSGQGPIEHGHYVPLSESLAQRIAKAYDEMPEVSRSPETIKAYEALAKEVGDQWDFAVKNLGITFEPWIKEGQPYANSREMVADVRNNKHLYFFQGGDPHPFLGKVDPKTGFNSNDKLRAVHDLFGHAAEDYQFGPRGEENAWIKHSQMFSPEAQRALSTETRGPNSWVNFGAQNYENGVNKNIPAKDRPFAAQKMALLPKELTDWRSALGKPNPNIAGFAYNPLLTNLGGAAGGFAYGFGEDPKASPEDRLINALKFAAVGGLAPSVARRAISAFATRPKTPIGPRSAQTITLEGQKKMFEHAPDAVTTAEVIKRFPGKVISEFQNALHEITRVEEKLRGSRPDLPMGDRFSLIAGAAGKAEAAFEPLLKLRNDLLKDMEPADLNVYLFNKRTIDRLTTQAKNEAAGLDKPSREVLDYEIADAQRLLRDQETQLGPDKWSRLEAFSDAYQKDADDNLRLVLASGLMNQKQYDQIKADNGFYAPFKVMKHLYGREGMEGVNTSTSMGSSTPFTKAVSGVTDQELKLGDMMIAAAENKLRAQVLAEKNMMMADFAGLVPLDTNGAFIRRLAPNAKVPDGWEKVSYAKDGLVQNLAVTPEIAKSLKGLNPAQLGVYTGALKTLSTGLRVGATTALVAFQTFNHLRDQFRMTVMSKAGVRSVDDLVQFPLDYLEGLGSSLLRPFGYNTSLTKEYLASGSAGATMSSNLRDNPYMRAAQAGNHAPMARLLGIPVESIIDTAAKIGNVLEETTKMTGYRRVARSENLKNLTGQAQKEALERIAYEVRNYVGSPDFAKAGNIGRELNAIFMFYNARLQGQTADMRRLIGRSGGPKEAAIAASKLTLMVGIPTTYIWFMNQRPENEQDYNSLSKFEKMAYLNIPRYDDNGQPFYRENSKGVMVRQYYRAPKFDIYSQMANLVEGGLNFSKTKDPMALAKAGESFLEGLSPLPISGDTLAQRAESVVSGMNPAVKTLVELGTGRNTFRHQPIVPRNLENTSPEKQYTDATPEFFKRAAAAVPKSFGPSFRSPLQLERITENLTGGALTQLMKKTPEGVDPRKSNPILSRFFSGPNVANEETWDLLDKLRTSDADLYIERDRKLKDLVKRKGSESWPSEVLNFIREDPEPNGRSVLQALKDETAGTTDADRTARRLSQESRAAYANAAMEKMKTPEGKAKVLRQLVDRGVVDRGTLLEMEVHRRLLEKKP